MYKGAMPRIGDVTAKLCAQMHFHRDTAAQYEICMNYVRCIFWLDLIIFHESKYAVIDAQRPLKAVQKAAKIAQRSLLFHCHQLPKKRPWAEDAAEFGKEEVAGEAPSRVVCTAAGKFCAPFIESQKSCLINFHKLGCATMFLLIWRSDMSMIFSGIFSTTATVVMLIPSISEVTGARRMVWSWRTLIPTKGTMKRRPLKPKGGSFWKGSLERGNNADLVTKDVFTPYIRSNMCFWCMSSDMVSQQADLILWNTYWLAWCQKTGNIAIWCDMCCTACINVLTHLTFDVASPMLYVQILSMYIYIIIYSMWL